MRFRSRLRHPGGQEIMEPVYIAGLVAAALLAYLVHALLNAEEL